MENYNYFSVKGLWEGYRARVIKNKLKAYIIHSALLHLSVWKKWMDFGPQRRDTRASLPG